MPKVKPTWYIVVAFVVAMIFLFATEDARGQTTDITRTPITISTGLGFGTFHYSGGVSQRIGVGVGPQDRWIYAYERLGGKGYNDVNQVSLVRRVRHDRTGLAGSIGVAYSDDYLEEEVRGEGVPLVSDKLTFVLGIDYTWTLSSKTGLRLGILHNSTAGRSERNHGIDRVYLSFNWRVQ